LNHFRRQTRLEHDLDEHVSGVRHVSAGLNTHAFPQTSAGNIFQVGNREREVERRDDPATADRPTKAHRPLVRHLARTRFVPKLASDRRGVVGGIDPSCTSPRGFGERLSHLAGHEVRDLLLALDEEVADAPQHVAARGSRRAPPQLESPRRRRHRAIDVRWRRQRKAADQIARVGGIAVLESSPLAGSHQSPAMKFWKVLVIGESTPRQAADMRSAARPEQPQRAVVPARVAPARAARGRLRRGRLRVDCAAGARTSSRWGRAGSGFA
jgi:hypothetical protein